ncbi:MAG TPA: hypothetical protein ACFYEK_08965 [Candidatus Wunengus sp. YC60]|uniref:hypothetical protein n=1 Tax=Candidatus Wunengus sp. YC60 TaxID=3367697 RepID=UPI00402914F7
MTDKIYDVVKRLKKMGHKVPYRTLVFMFKLPYKNQTGVYSMLLECEKRCKQEKWMEVERPGWSLYN